MLGLLALTCAFGINPELKFMTEAAASQKDRTVLTATHADAQAYVVMSHKHDNAEIVVEDLLAAEPGHYILEITVPLSALTSKSFQLSVENTRTHQNYRLTCF